MARKKYVVEEGIFAALMLPRNIGRCGCVEGDELVDECTCLQALVAQGLSLLSVGRWAKF